MSGPARRFGIVGGGPAGLYTAILLKRDDPSRQVRLVERNPPDATYGWGVVFSADTLAELRAADERAFLALDARLTRWDALDVRRGDTVMRAYGHGFSAIRRTALLEVLQERAADVGVEMDFEREAAGPRALDDADVLVAADGTNSTLRDKLADRLGVSITEETTRFAWFGAGRAYDAFTFAFRHTPHGLFTAHAYPIDADTSTFIVECRPETWRAAGLDDMGESDSLAFCEEVFADDLDGAPLYSNRSIWMTFDTVRCRRWHDGRVVLVGDAAHTAHFTIGSGTKLAVEDATALARAFLEHPGEPTAAMSAYELERRGPVERFQDAAGDSARYFANIARYEDFDDEQFTFNLLTRSGRVTRRDVERRDPALAGRVDRWFAGAAVGREPDRDLLVDPPSHQPLELRGTALANRVAVRAEPTDAAEDGRPGADDRAALERAARTGAGLVLTDLVAVTPGGRITPGSPGLWSDDHAAAWEELAAAVRSVSPSGAGLGLRLGHAGRRGATRPRDRALDRPLPDGGGWELLAPTAEPYLPGGRAPRAATAGDLEEVTGAFADAARRAAGLPVDVLVVDASDGYLLGSFLSPLVNDREDELGGDAQRRRAWPLEVVTAVREAWPDGRPLAVRLTCDDRLPGGITPVRAVGTARRLAEAGVDLVEAVSGHSVSRYGGAEYRRAWRLALADRIRNEAGVATVASGRIGTLDRVDTAVAAGRADVCVLNPWRYAAESIRTARSVTAGNPAKETP